jgi:kynurenine formamidase
MRSLRLRARKSLLALAGFFALGTLVGLGLGQEEKWWPSRYGPDDEQGALNEITPAKVKEAAALVREGKTYHLSMVLREGVPAFAPRTFSMHMPYHSVVGYLGANKLQWSEEVVFGWLGSFTQLDCLGHIGLDDRWYNGRHWRDIFTPGGLKMNSCEKLRPIVTRGVLLDIAGLKGVDVLQPDNYVITVADIEAAIRRQGNIRIGPGDVVILHTGWMKILDKDPKRWISNEPGIYMDAARWFAQRRIAVLGADTWGIDAVPGPDGTAFAPHQELITKNGIMLFENAVTEELVRDKVYEFMIVLGIVRVKGSGQTWATAIAIR